MLTAIRQWVIKTMMKDQSGVVRILPKREIIELNTQMTAERLMRNGINPQDMKTVGQVENVIKQIDTPKANVNTGVTSVKKADVMDMEGNKIPEGSKIIGGKEVPTSIDQENFLSRVNRAVQENRESEAAIKARLEADNKKGLESIREKQYEDAVKREQAKADADPDYIMQIIDPEDFATGGRVGLKGAGFINFIKNLGKGMNKKSPVQAYKDYLKDVKKRTLNANETGRFRDLPLEVLPIAASGALVTRGMKKVLENQEEKNKEERLENFIRELENDEFYQKYPELKDETIANYTESLFGVKRADGGRIGLKGAGFINFLKKFKIKSSGDPFKEFLSKRKFLKDMVGNTETNRKARELRMLKEAAEKARKEGGYKFPEVTKEEIEKKIAPILLKDRKFNADGGRIGYKVGSVDKIRRLLLKTIGAGTAGVAAAKSGIFSFGKGATKQVAKEVAQQTTSSMPPPYFFKLAEKIKNLGNDVTSTSERTITKSLKSKDGKAEYLLEEDVTTGSTIIKKINKESDDMISDVEIMQLNKGDEVVTKEGKVIRAPDDYEEVTEYHSRIYKDAYNDPDYVDGINVDDIIKEVDDKTPSIKYAQGGLAYMLGE